MPRRRARRSSRSASGTVVSAGWSGGGGNMVHIRHASGFESYYLHLSAFGKGVRPGAHVDQGQLIGRVGSTGTATGPHLDYRLRKNGVFVESARRAPEVPPGEPIPGASLPTSRAGAIACCEQIATALRAAAGRQAADAAVVAAGSAADANATGPCHGSPRRTTIADGSIHPFRALRPGALPRRGGLLGSLRRRQHREARQLAAGNP